MAHTVGDDAAIFHSKAVTLHAWLFTEKPFQNVGGAAHRNPKVGSTVGGGVLPIKFKGNDQCFHVGSQKMHLLISSGRVTRSKSTLQHFEVIVY